MCTYVFGGGLWGKEKKMKKMLFYLPSRRKVISSKYAKRKYFSCEYMWNVSKIGKCSERKKAECKAA